MIQSDDLQLMFPNNTDIIILTPVLSDETVTCMRLLGVEKVDDLGMQHVRTNWNLKLLIIHPKFQIHNFYSSTIVLSKR